MGRRKEAIDAQGRRWEIALVPAREALEHDARFWLENMTPEQRVDAVDDCLLDCMKTRGKSGPPRLRRVCRLVERRGR